LFHNNLPEETLSQIKAEILATLGKACSLLRKIGYNLNMPRTNKKVRQDNPLAPENKREIKELNELLELVARCEKEGNPCTTWTHKFLLIEKQA